MNNIVDKQKLWTGSFIKVCLVNLFIFVNFHSLLPTFPFFVKYLGGDAVAIGLATALFSVASIVSRPFVGWLVDTKGRCCILVAGLIGMALMPMGYFVSAGIAFAVVLRTAHGAFHAASSNAVSTWVTDIIPHSRMGEGLGMYGLSMAVSTAVAPALGLAVMNAWGFRPLFALATVSAVIALLIGISIKNRDYTAVSKPLRASELFEPMSLPASVTQFFFMVTYGVIEVYVAIYASTNRLPGGGIYFIFIAVSTVLTRILLGRAVDKYGEARLVYTGNVACMAGILLLVFCHNLPCYVISALLMGYSFGAIQPSLQTMAMHAVAPERRGAASSTFFVAFDFGIALGGFIAGVLVKYCGYDMMFLLIGLSCVLSLSYYYFFGRNHASSFNPSNRRTAVTAGPSSAVHPDAAGALPAVITISREYGSGGHLIGELLAKKLGYWFYDKEIIALTAKESGLGESVVKDSEQTVDGMVMYDNPTQDAVFHAQSRVIRDISSKEPCVIVGRLANFILKDRPYSCNVFIYADMEHRIGRISGKYGLSTEEAAAKIRKTDKERSGHCLHYTGEEWGGCHNYHLMLDSSLLGYEGSADIIAEALKDIRV